MKFSRLKFVATIIAGQAPSGDTVTDAGTTPFLQGCAEFGLRTPAATRYCEVASKFACKDDWLFSVRAPVGRMNRSDREYGIGRGLAAIRDKAMDGLYLGFALESSAPNLSAVSTGSTYEAVSTSQIGNLLIPLPELPTQRKIAAFLDQETARIDALIEKNERLICLCAERLTAYLRETFSPTAEDCRRFRFIAQVEKGKTTQSAADDEGDLPLITPEYLRHGKAKLFVNGQDADVTDQDVIVVWDGSAGDVLRGRFGVLSSTLARVVVSDSVNSNYLFYALRSQNHIIKAAAQGMGIPHVSGVALKNLILKWPSADEQERIVNETARTVDALESLIVKTKRMNKLLREKRSALITAAVTGQIDIPE